MDFVRTGIILNTENYKACRDFYGSVLGLPKLDQFGQGAAEITVFGLGDTYLMVEHGGVSYPSVKRPDICPAKFRFNVTDIASAADALRSKGVDVTVRKHAWGTTAEFSDPDGNRCALRSEEDFGSERQA